MSDETEAMITAATATLTRELWQDIKQFIPSLFGAIRKSAKALRRETLASPAHFLDELANGNINDGDVVTIAAKPSAFGPYLRNHLFSPMVGTFSSNRLGPSIESDIQPLAMIVNTMTMLSPVGLYPKLANDAIQGCLYPSDASAFGFNSFLPLGGINSLIISVPSLFSPEYISHYHKPCHVTGVARLVDSATFESAGFSPEDHETVRQAGSFWIFDGAGEESDCVPLADGVITPMWGSLYACGHLEFDGQLERNLISNAVVGAMRQQGYDVRVHQDIGARPTGTAICGRGVRAMLAQNSPVFSIQTDVDLALDYAASRKRFDALSTVVLESIANAFKEAGTPLQNENDLDFTYTNATNSYKVLQSLSADEIRDPLAIAIRDWHRTRVASNE